MTTHKDDILPHHPLRTSVDPNATVNKILENQPKVPVSPKAVGSAFAPTNIALCKYWGKRHNELNLPMTNSLSISLGNLGAFTQIRELTEDEQDFSFRTTEGKNSVQDSVCVNGQETRHTPFQKRLTHFLNLFRPSPETCYRVETTVNIPIAAGLASSACGFAALVKALKELYGWELSSEALSVLARLGSGSACRSLWDGFVEWEKGEREDGLDSRGVSLNTRWPELRLGLLIVDEKQKSISSRVAMKQTMETSLFYSQWPKKVEQDLCNIKKAVEAKDFILLGETSEANANAMHALMLTAQPPIQYSTPKTLALINSITECRKDNLPVYFTQDAGPNLKLLFLEQDQCTLMERFPMLRVVAPFDSLNKQVQPNNKHKELL